MKAKLIVDNREIEVEIPEEQLKVLISKQEKKTGYERVNKGCPYHFVNTDGTIKEFNEELYYSIDGAYYEIANYYSDKDIAVNNARADKLMRQLRRFAVENRKNPLNWEENNSQMKYYIYYRTSDVFEYPELKIDCCYEDKHFGVIYFDTKEAAQKAIETFHDELIWYFTEYKDSL